MRLRRLLDRLRRAWWRLRKPLTVGVRVLLIRGNKVVLVWHSYQDRWYLPGGGVERGETLLEAIRREAREELGAELGELRIHGVYTSFYEGKSDHVVVFSCDEFELGQPDGAEVTKVAEFDLTALPEGTSPGTRRRIDEVLIGAGPHHGTW
jgi:8-oxo-dGTP pyrophosphatase MutT (NUDIX family)